MIALDTNLLVYAHHRESPHHSEAGNVVAQMANGERPWCLPWPVAHEYVAVVTHPRLFVSPVATGDACAAIKSLLASPRATAIGEAGRYWSELSTLAERARAVGPMVYDARIAAVCLANGVRELWTADRDFGRFPDLKVRNPLVG